MEFYTQKRDADFIEACYNEIRRRNSQGSTVEIYDVVTTVLAQPAPTFYFTYERARRTVVKHRRNGTLPAGKSMASHMWRDIVTTVDRMLRETPGLRVYDAVWRIFDRNSVAPRFYITPRRGVQILSRSMRRAITYYIA